MSTAQPVYRGKVVDLFLERVPLPNGTTAELEIVRHPGGAAVVAIDNDDHVCLLRQYRHAGGGWLWELPAGRLEPGEPAQATAQRELEEEAGSLAAEWQTLGRIFSSPGVFTEIIHLFLATGLSTTAQRHETHEVIEVHWTPFPTALAMAANGEIVDAKTVAGLFRAAQRLEAERALRA